MSMRGKALCFAAISITCVVGFGVAAANEVASKSADSRVTFYQDVLPILQDNCQKCHRPGGANLGGMVAPMSFTTYRETRPWAKAIAQNVAERNMPPWHAAPEQHGLFANERTLTQDQIDTLVQWASTGAARGNPNDAPEPIEWADADGWSIGEPDLIVQMPEAFFVDDNVEDLYRDFHSTITEEMLPEERFIKAIEFRPGSSVVHHIIAFPLGGIAPGNDPTVYPDGIGQTLRPGTDITWQMHYHKEAGPGTGVWDQSKAAIKFYPKDAEVKYQLKGNHLGRFDFAIPPGEADYSIQQEYVFKHDSQIVQFMPHMHLRGKSAKYEAYYPDGTHEVLLNVPEYDFNWQTSYQYKEFKEVPAGTKVVFTSSWDNSTNNPYNPDPTAEVRWGRPTTAEMSFGYMSFINESPEREPMFGGRGEEDEGGSRRGRRGGGPNIAALLSNFDANGDGLLQKDEAPDQMKTFFDMMDANGDGGVSAEEAEQAMRRFRGGDN